MSKKYKSGISKTLIIFLVIVFGGSIMASSLTPPYWAGILSISPAILFVVHLFQTTYYFIQENTLHIKAGFIVNIKVDIRTITSISKTNNIMSAPAFSFDRIEIKYGKGLGIILSPKDQASFIADLKLKNDSIELKGLN